MHIDHDFNVNAAKGAKLAGITHYGLLSAVNASAGSWFLYPKCKGLIEKELKEMSFPSLSIFQPGLLNRGALARWNEKLVLWCMPSIQVASVARAMRIVAGRRSVRNHAFSFPRGRIGESGRDSSDSYC